MFSITYIGSLHESSSVVVDVRQSRRSLCSGTPHGHPIDTQVWIAKPIIQAWRELGTSMRDVLFINQPGGPFLLVRDAESAMGIRRATSLTYSLLRHMANG
jgi:hypothetical protein